MVNVLRYFKGLCLNNMSFAESDKSQANINKPL
jgi:hypothetical protein